MPSCGLSSSEKKRHGSPVKFVSEISLVRGFLVHQKLVRKFVGVMVTRLLILRTRAAVELLIIFQIASGHVKIQYRLILKLLQ